MDARARLAEKWLASALEPHGMKIAQRAAADGDLYRNPVGYVLRSNMAALVSELLGAMDAEGVDAAFANIVAVRAVQDLSVEQALGFVYALREIVRAEMPDVDIAELDKRIDQFSLSAFAQYLRCREQLLELRFNERLRSFGGPPLRRHHSAGAPRRAVVP